MGFHQPTLELRNVAQINRGRIAFGDLTVLVGPQATGKSIVLQFLKLILDTGHIQEELRRHGLDWSKDLPEFLKLFFGEGMDRIWREDSSVLWHGKLLNLRQFAVRKKKVSSERLFFIPAQRVLTLRDGWPRPFTDYAPGDPFTVREFSEKLRVLMENEFSSQANLFPQAKRLKVAIRDLLTDAVFSGFDLNIDKHRSQKRLVLSADGNPLLYMVWSAGQREFVPLLLGLILAIAADENTTSRIHRMGGNRRIGNGTASKSYFCCSSSYYGTSMAWISRMYFYTFSTGTRVSLGDKNAAFIGRNGEGCS